MFSYSLPDPSDVGGHDVDGHQGEGKEDDHYGKAYKEDDPSAFLGNGAVFLCQEHIVKSAHPGDAVFHEGLILAQGHVLLVSGFRRGGACSKGGFHGVQGILGWLGFAGKCAADGAVGQVAHIGKLGVGKALAELLGADGFQTVVHGFLLPRCCTGIARVQRKCNGELHG